MTNSDTPRIVLTIAIPKRLHKKAKDICRAGKVENLDMPTQSIFKRKSKKK